MDHEQIGVEPFSSSQQAAERFFREIRDSGVLPEDMSASDAASAVLCTLAMRLSGGEAVDLVESLPPRLQALLVRCPRHRRENAEPFDRETFLHHVARHLDVGFAASVDISRAVFAALRRVLPDEEIFDIESQLPRDLVELWTPIGVPVPDARARGVRPVEEPTKSILREVDESGTLPPSTSAREAVGAVVCALAKQLTGGEVRQLADVSPPTLQAMLGHCAGDRGEEPETFDRPTFEHYVADHLGIEPEKAGRITRAVFAALRPRIPPTELAQIDNRLRRDLLALWQR